MSVETLTRSGSTGETPHLSLDLDELNLEFANLEPQGRIARASEILAGRLVLPTTFGPTAPVMLKYANEIVPDVPVINIRHGHETARTLELSDYYEQELDLNLYVYEAPKLAVPVEGTPEFKEFQRQIKVVPFQNMLTDLRPRPDAYLSGVMRWQTPRRAGLPFVEQKGSVLAINPVLDLSEADVADFFEKTGLPKNDDYFDPAKGANQKSECQLNTTKWNAQ